MFIDTTLTAEVFTLTVERENFKAIALHMYADDSDRISFNVPLHEY